MVRVLRRPAPAVGGQCGGAGSGRSAASGRCGAILDTVPVGIMIAEAPSGRIIGRNKMRDQIIGAADAIGGEATTSTDYAKHTAYHLDGPPHRAA